MDHVSFAVSQFTKESWVFLGLWTAFLSALNCQSQVNDSLFSPLKQRKILYRCSTLNWFDFLHIILRLILRLNQVPFKENVLVATSAASLSFVYQNSKERHACDVLRHGQLSTRLSLFLHISPFKHTRCQRGSFCSSWIRKLSLLDLVPQWILREVIEVERISFSLESKVVLERQVCRAYSSHSSTFRKINGRDFNFSRHYPYWPTIGSGLELSRGLDFVPQRYHWSLQGESSLH
jgi:hypothetical protein